MLVRDIKSSAKAVLGFPDDPTLYDRLTDAIEVLSNKGQWDSMQGYLDMFVSPNRVITLPRMVETPIKLNINDHPSFSRSKLYEFSMNGPNSNMQDTAGFSWMDTGEVPVLRQPDHFTTLTIVDPDANDEGSKITFYGRDSENIPFQEEVLLNPVTPQVTENQFQYIDRVVKDLTYSNVTVVDDNNNALAIYEPDETEPFYRQIRLSQSANSVRMLFRRRTAKIASDDDWIPLQSRAAILLMLKSLELFRNARPEEFQQAQALEAQALKFLQEEQSSRNNFDIAQNTETPPVLDLNYNNSDSITVADIYDDAAQIFGTIGRDNLFDKITDSIELLSNKGHWDGLTGYVDINTDNYHYVTFPRYVEAPISINVNGTPKMMRNKWFEFHLNGPGSGSSYCKAWDYVGDVVTLRPLPTAMQFIAKPDLTTDDGKIITIYGYDENGKWIRTEVGGNWIDGFQVVNDHTGALPATNAQKCSRIERITRGATTGFVQLIGYDSTRAVSATIGYYYPDETEPNYVRIRLPVQATWIRMRYRKRSLKVSSLTDPIHLKSKLAIKAAMMSVRAMQDGDVQKATDLEGKATQYLI